MKRLFAVVVFRLFFRRGGRGEGFLFFLSCFFLGFLLHCAQNCLCGEKEQCFCRKEHVCEFLCAYFCIVDGYFFDVYFLWYNI